MRKRIFVEKHLKIFAVEDPPYCQEEPVFVRRFKHQGLFIFETVVYQKGQLRL